MPTAGSAPGGPGSTGYRERLQNLILRAGARLVLRPKRKGLEHLRALGAPGILLAARNSPIDPFLICRESPERLTVVIDESWARHFSVSGLKEAAGVLPVNLERPLGPQGAKEALEKGARLLIFPETALSAGRSTSDVSSEAADFVRGSGLPVTPVVADGAQYSRLGGEGRRSRLGAPGYPATVTFLPPRELGFQPVEGEGAPRRRERAGEALYFLMQNARFEAMDFRQNLWERLELAASWYGKNRPILEDASRAPLTYAEIISRARLLSLRLEDLTLRGERVGVLLPNRTLHALVLFALWSIGRVPVILNYTQGPALLNQALLAAGVKTIVSSRRFLEKAGLGEAASRLEAKTVFAEDFSFALSDRVAASLRTPAPEPPDCPAVVLFTAGSEGAPKGVAHSHQGLLANQLQAACHLECSEDDVFFNAVPMFHAAGLNMLLLAPLLQGMRSFLYPTPLHPHRIPRLIRELGVTVAAASASAAGAWARGARPRDFASVRVFVAGSERVSEETRGRFLKDFGVRVYEGYGVAEAGPALSASTPAHFKEGSCGRFLPGIERKLDPVEGLDKGGALSVKGPNVMMGYLLSDGTGELQPPPGGWHNTGDIVEEDQDGYVWIRGRQRRFAKVGGEMVSLAAVEDVLGRLWPGRPLAVMAADDPRRGERLVLATQERSVDVVGLRAAIRAAGLPEIAVPRQFVRLPTIPLTTAGAVDFAELRQQVAEALKAQAEGQGSAAEAEKAEKAEKAEAAEKVGNAEADE